MKDEICDDCAGFDFEWMHQCNKHKTKFCRGCSCPDCNEADADEDYLSEEKLEEKWALDITDE